jgi:RNase P subunit RPR2
MNEELLRKIKDASSLHKKYVQMMKEYTDKNKQQANEDFNRRIMKVYHCMINKKNVSARISLDEIDKNSKNNLGHNIGIFFECSIPFTDSTILF